ncbi:MAG: energy-coupling factor transporter transmembrane protein EcfT [Calditerrivibrio sp.]|nr:energy-coupling factor transporter transmembrane protein EcfT [Calditerrivibrio sp.]
MSKKIPKQEIANFIKSINPAVKFILLIGIFLEITKIHSWAILLLYTCIALLIIISFDSMVNVYKQFKALSYLLFLISFYSLYIVFTSDIGIREGVFFFYNKFLILTSIFLYSYLFVRSCSKNDLVRVAFHILYPLTLLVDKKELQRIMINTVYLSEKNLVTIQKKLKTFEWKKVDINLPKKLVTTISDIFYETLTSTYHIKRITPYRALMLTTLRYPSKKDILVLIIFIMVLFGTDVIQ